jgi:hypothetical protein
MSDNNVDVNIDDMFSAKPDKDQLKLIDEIIDLHSEISDIDNKMKEKNQELKEKISILKDLWQTNQITSMKKNGYELELKPVEKYSIPSKKDKNNDDRSEKIKKLIPFFAECGFPEVIKEKEWTCHHNTFDSTVKEIIKSKLYSFNEILEKYPFINHYEDQQIKISEI